MKKFLTRVFTVALLFAFVMPAIFDSTVQAAAYGDVNQDGLIDVRDVVLVMRHILELDTLNETEQNLADVNADGAIDVRDATLLMQKSLGLIDHFPDLDEEEVDLIKEIIIEEGISPGKKLVIVMLDVANPEDFIVKVGQTSLQYRASIEGFRGEVDEDEADRSKVSVLKQD